METNLLELKYLSDEINCIEAENENKGLYKFYTFLADSVRHTDYIDDYPTIQSYTENEMSREVDIPDTRKKLYEKTQFYIDYLKSGQYIELLPRLTIFNNKIKCIDHIILNKSDKNINFNYEHLYNQTVSESTDKSNILLKNNYEIIIDDIVPKIKSFDPHYILYLPYYFLMEYFRTEVDPLPMHVTGNFRTVRRDKQKFLNTIYNKLVEKEILIYDSYLEDLNIIHKHFHFSWMNTSDLDNFYIQHYYNIFDIFLNQFLLEEKSTFCSNTYEDTNIKEIINKIERNQKKIPTPDSIYSIIKTVLVERQKTLFTHSKEIDTDIKYRFIRNILVELILHNKSYSRIESEKSQQRKKTTGMRKQEQHISADPSYKPQINTYYQNRSLSNIQREAKKLEDIKEILHNPANYEAFFRWTSDFEMAMHPFRELYNQYKKYARHYKFVFPKLNEIKSDAEQLWMLLYLFQRVGLIVHIKLPVEECKATNTEINWYAEYTFWNNTKQKEKAIDFYRDEYQFAINDDTRKIYDEWLNYLSLGLKGANKKTDKKEIKRIKKINTIMSL